MPLIGNVIQSQTHFFHMVTTQLGLCFGTSQSLTASSWQRIWVLQHDDEQRQIRAVLGGDVLNERALLGLGAGGRLAALLPIAERVLHHALRERRGRGAQRSPEQTETKPEPRKPCE